jgi:hypothetical protein
LPRGKGRRAAVVVQANLFARIIRVVKSYANQIGARCGEGASGEAARALTKKNTASLTHTPSSAIAHAVSAAEDPEKILDQVVNEMQEDLIKMRQASAQVRAASFCTRRRQLAAARRSNAHATHTRDATQRNNKHTGDGVAEADGGQVQAGAGDGGETERREAAVV